MHSNTGRSIRAVLGTTAFLAAIAASHSASATVRVLAGQAGHALIAADASCFAESYGTVTNTCGAGTSDWKYWAIPFAIDYDNAINGTTTVYPPVHVYTPNPTTNPIYCYAYGISNWYPGGGPFSLSMTAEYHPLYSGSTTLISGTPAPSISFDARASYGMVVCRVYNAAQITRASIKWN